MKTERKHITIEISGDLKETGIRFSAMHEAYKAGVTGITRFTPGGALFIEVEGLPEQVETFKVWCSKIAEKYNKNKIEYEDAEIRDYTEFNIID